MNKLLPIVEKIVDDFTKDVKECPHIPMNDSLIPFLLLTAQKWHGGAIDCVYFEDDSCETNNFLHAINAKLDNGHVVIETFTLIQYLPPALLAIETTTHIRRWNLSTTHLEYYCSIPEQNSPFGATIRLNDDSRGKDARLEWRLPANPDGEKFLRELHTLFRYRDD